MKYLQPSFSLSVSTPKIRHEYLIERGGLPAEIPAEDRCSSGRHNLRLTKCLCSLFNEKT